jgi:hypothetical protein
LERKVSKFLFDVTATDRIECNNYYETFIKNLSISLPRINRIVLTCYRAGNPITELIIYQEDEKLFCLTVWEGELDVTPVTADDIRVAHKEISLPDATDILIFVTKIARYLGLSPLLSADPCSSSVLEFNS